MPHVPMLTVNNARQGFFERHEFDAVLAHLPAYLHAPLRFAFVTGWRFKSEVLPLTADRVDLGAGVVRLDPGATKNNEGRSLYVTAELREVLTAQLDSIAMLRKRDIICPMCFTGRTARRSRTSGRRGRTPARRLDTPASCFMIPDGRPCARRSAPACRARWRWRWSATRQSRSIAAAPSWTSRRIARRRQSWTHRTSSSERRPTLSERDSGGGSKNATRAAHMLLL